MQDARGFFLVGIVFGFLLWLWVWLVFLPVLSCFVLVDCFWLRIDSFSACSLLGFFSFRFALIRIRPLYPFGGPPRGRRLERKGPVSEDTGPTPNRGCIQGHPTGLGHLPEEVVAHRLENGKKLARLQPAPPC